MNHFIFCFILLLSLAACAKPTSQPPIATSAQIQHEQEIQKNMAAQVQLEKQQRHEQSRMQMQQRLQYVYAPIARAALGLCADLHFIDRDNSCTYEVILEKSGPLNAAADGKAVHITPTMLSFTDNDDELAMVLAHEVAHNIMQHPSSQKVNTIAGMAAGILVDSVAAYYGYNSQGAFANMGGGLAQMHYSADFEREADYIGMYILARSGYDYEHVADFWRRLGVKEPESIYISTTHPTTPERFVSIANVVTEINAKKAQNLALVPEIKVEQEAETLAVSPAYPAKLRH